MRRAGLVLMDITSRGGPGVCHIQLMAEASRVATVSLWGNAAGPAWACRTAAGVGAWWQDNVPGLALIPFFIIEYMKVKTRLWVNNIK